MPMIYDLSLATAGDLTTSGTPGTETEAFFVKPGSTRNVGIQAIDVIGKAAGLTAISGIVLRLVRLATASTGGTAITPRPKDEGWQAAVCTAASRGSVGSTRVNRAIFGCSAGGPGGWWAKNEDSVEMLPAGSAASLSMLDASGTASMKYEFNAEIRE